MSRGSTSDHVIHQGKNWGMIIVVGLVLLLFAPVILGGLGGLAVSAVPEAADAGTCWPTKPICPPERVRPSSTTPTTAAPRTLNQEELDARQQAKQIGDGLAKAKATQPAPAPDPRGGLPAIGEAGGGSVLGQLIPGAEGTIRAIGPGLMKALNP